MHKYIKYLIIFIFFIGTDISFAQEDAMELMQANQNLFTNCNTEYFEACIIEGVEDNCKKAEQKFKVWASYATENSDQYKSIIKFTTGKKVGQMTWLNLKEKSKLYWLKIGSILKRVKPDSESRKFNKTPLTYRDLRDSLAMQLEESKFTAFGEAEIECDGEKILCYIIKEEFLPDDKSGYGSKNIYLEKGSALKILKIEYFDLKNKLIKTQVNSNFQDYENTRGEKVHRSKKIMINEEGDISTILFYDREIDPDWINESYFTDNFLRK